jgi:SsrA-binding protein
MNITTNRKAHYEFSILQEFEAGVVLIGNEVKSIRKGDVTIGDSFIYIRNGEVWAKNVKVAKYKQSYSGDTHDDNRDKKLLLNRTEINKIEKLANATSQMHLALLSNPKNAIEFKKELLEDNRKLLEQDLEKLISNRIESLNKLEDKLTQTDLIYFKRLEENKDKIISMMHTVIRNAYNVSCIRIHGDYHLGQALWTGNDFVILDFEGEPDKPHVYRRSKFPCLKDVAGVIRSFH